MNIGDILLIGGRSENQGLEFNLNLMVTKDLDRSTYEVKNIYNKDTFILNLDWDTFTSKLGSSAFYSDDFTLFNITQNTKII